MLNAWLTAIARVAGREREIADILDLGCGAGRYAAALAQHFGASVVAMDPLEKMLEQARRKPSAGVRFLRGAGEALPVPDASVDLVFMSMVFHHFADPAQVARECRRVLRKGAVAVMRIGATDRVDDYPYVPFFPRTRALISRSLTTLAMAQQTFVEAGFEQQAHEVVMSETAASWPDYAERAALRADSILIQLTDEEFAEGLAALRTFAGSAAADGAVVEPVDLLAFRRLEGEPFGARRRVAGALHQK